MQFGTVRNDKRGFIRVSTRSEYLWFSHDFESQAVAIIVIKAIEDAMYERIKSIRKEAYEAGWKAAKGRKKKATRFYGCINGDMVGY